ncbi:MAG: hypothetical protein AVDCRST_MAG49-1849 [uncultured Thermomicrobiales bacterium]|uniref:Uncharacterized protein n=1 Tax=uncultured Thermomicrobiales bacterium TaxID=1645740 RepID=A0A6J4UK57_9BACT|nr:MAG: hypothetical protein AVDCRST_MAG49-1849 [uncultured Thermomicrobiales bacterium]
MRRVVAPEVGFDFTKTGQRRDPRRIRVGGADDPRETVAPLN